MGRLLLTTWCTRLQRMFLTIQFISEVRVCVLYNLGPLVNIKSKVSLWGEGLAGQNVTFTKVVFKIHFKPF